MSKLLDELASKAGSEITSIALPWWIKIAPYVLVLLIVGGCGYEAYSFGVHTEHMARVAEVSQLNKAHSDELWAIDKAHRDALQKMQADEDAKEHEASARMAELDAKHFQELNDANAKADAAVAAVRAGTLRVRQRFTCPAVHSDAGASGAAAQAASSAGLGDGTGGRGLSDDDAQILLRIGARANGVGEKLKACQAILSADRLDQ